MSSSHEIASHHAIRGIAALLVVLLHLQEILLWGDIDLDHISPFIRKGYLWVDCFFILSGFILSYVYAGTLKVSVLSEFQKVTVGFLRARFARIYPLHLFTLCLMLVIRQSALWARSSDAGLFWGANDLRSFMTNVFLLQSWELHDSTTWNRPSWSISTEAFAYLLFPLLCLIHARMRRFFTLLLIFVPMLGYSTLFAVEHALDQTFHLGLLRCVSGFVLGMGVFYTWQAIKLRERRRFFALQIPLVVGLIFSMHMTKHDGVAVGLFAALVFLTADDEGLLARFLRQPTLLRLGMVSYSVYMVHYPVIYFASEYKWFLFDYWVGRGVCSAEILSIVLFLFFGTLVIALSTLTYRFIEIPARRRLGRRPTHNDKRTMPPTT